MWKWARGVFNCRASEAFLALSALTITGLFLLLHFQRPFMSENSIRRNIRTAGETLNRRGSGERGHDRAVESPDPKQRAKIKLVPGKNDHGTLISPRKTTERKMSSCIETQQESRFREVERGTLVYSAWFDDRKSQRLIRVLILTSTRKPLPSLFCHFNNVSKHVTSGVSYYQLSGNHYMQFGGFVASCVLPPELDRIPCFVNISTRSTSTQNESNSVALPVSFIDRQHSVEKVTSRRQYGICIPPLHGEISVDRLIEFLELSQILGASHFTFYDVAMSDSVRKVLNYYEDKGLARVLPWNLPSYIGKYDIHYFGQTLSIMDCLFRSMSHLDFVAFNDLDEFIVPLQHDNMSALLLKIHKDEHCAHCFQSATFDPSREDLQISQFLTQRVFHRTKKATPFWNKCIVDPRRIFEQGIHHIVKPIEDNYIDDNVNWSIARVFHYRKCKDTHALMHCSGAVEEDKTMQKFGERLQRNFEINVATANISRS